MKRRFFLGLAAAALLSGAALAQGPPAQAPADRVTVEELKRMLADGKPVLILDVRAEAELVIKGARHIPLDQVESRLGELPKGREVVTYCAWPNEATSARAAQTLRDHDFKARALLGGWNAWRDAGGETEPRSAGGDGATHADAPPHPPVKEAAPGGAPAAVKGTQTEAAAAARRAPVRKARKRQRRSRQED